MSGLGTEFGRCGEEGGGSWRARVASWRADGDDGPGAEGEAGGQLVEKGELGGELGLRLELCGEEPAEVGEVEALVAAGDVAVDDEEAAVVALGDAEEVGGGGGLVLEELGDVALGGGLHLDEDVAEGDAVLEVGVEVLDEPGVGVALLDAVVDPAEQLLAGLRDLAEAGLEGLGDEGLDDLGHPHAEAQLDDAPDDAQQDVGDACAEVGLADVDQLAAGVGAVVDEEVVVLHRAEAREVLGGVDLVRGDAEALGHDGVEEGAQQQPILAHAEELLGDDGEVLFEDCAHVGIIQQDEIQIFNQCANLRLWNDM